MKIFTALVVALGLILLTGAPAQADETLYAPWQGQLKAGDMMPEMLKNLRTLTDQAERDKAADPDFLADLRKVIGDYDNRYRWPVALLFDDFRDGEFASNPAWQAVAGSWQVVNRSGSSFLSSSVRRDSGYNTQSNSGNDALANVLGVLLNQQNGQGQNQSGQYQQGRDASASIVAPVAISDQFYIRLELVSRQGGQFNFGPYAGRRAQDSYQVTYKSGAANGLVLTRVSNQGSQLLGQSRGPIDLDNNQLHVIEWKRGPAGKMTVVLDGKPVIEATDAGIRKPFGGLLMVNTGGTYGIRSVAIDGVNQ